MPTNTKLRFLASLAILSLVATLIHTPAARAQDAPAADETAATAPADGVVAEEAPADEPTGGDPPTAAEEPAGDTPVDEASAEAEAPAEETPADEASAEDGDAETSGGDGGINWTMLLATLAVVVVPIVVGNWLAKAIRMPDYAWKIATVLLALAIAGACVGFGEFKGGPDLAGGITLVYEIAGGEASAPAGGEGDDEAAVVDERAAVDVDRLIDALKQRIDPAGTKEVTIRRYGDAIEIIIPHAGQADLDFIKRRITDLGQLEFRIVADRRWSEDAPTIEKALQLGPSQKLVEVNGRAAAKWVLYDEREFPADDGRLIRREAGARKEALVLIDRYNVTGEYLTTAAKGVSDLGRPSVDFSFNASGAARFGRFTGENLPSASGAARQLAILLDEKILTAPNLNSRITDRGTISGGQMTEEEVDYVISILNAGSLPAALNKEPISEETVSPTLGATTIQKGKKAMLWSLDGVLAFMLIYYRFAGMMACLALAGTILLVLGAMVALNAAFTLPGLAGLVLTVGMAVDANVLIFERIREEMRKGAGLRMAIRNGFDRATTTIVDANVTTLLTGVVLYTVGTDQIRGFAVTLVLGILMSMFMAIFASRMLFEIAERRRWIKTLSFGHILGETNIDFLGLRWGAIGLSLVVIALGAFGVFSRGADMLNIDFSGGTSVTMALREDSATPIAEVRSVLEESSLGERNLGVVERGESGTRYTVNTNVESVAEAEDAIAEAFAGKLLTYSVDVGEPKPFSEPGGYEGTDVPLTFNQGAGYGAEDGMAHDALLARIREVLKEQGAEGVLPQLTNDNYLAGSSQRFKEWNLRVGLPSAEAVAAAEGLESALEGQALFPLANKIGGQVASDLQEKAIYAAVVSILGIVAYLWFRFQNVNFGLAAVIAVVHDVLVTIGAIALSSWVVAAAPPLADALQLESFQISLPIVAALITVIGYSLNDTIVIFDRVREVRGKSPKITNAMINTSVNQTLSRTLLTSLTTLIVVSILYFFGGPGIHGFAFALVVGVFVGTYSTVFIASPALLWLAGDEPPPEDSAE